MSISEKPNNTITLHHWLKATYPTAKYCSVGNEYSGLDWSDTEITKPTEQQCTDGISTMQSNYDAQEYARKRKAKYDALNQFELISDDAINGTTTHKDAILAIKAEFPKP